MIRCQVPGCGQPATLHITSAPRMLVWEFCDDHAQEYLNRPAGEKWPPGRRARWDYANLAEPSWVRATLRPLPAPIYAVTSIFAAGVFAAIFLIQALVHRQAVYWWLTGVSATLAVFICVATSLRLQRLLKLR